MNRAAVVSLHSLTALASAHLVKQSIAVIMYLVPVRFPGGLCNDPKPLCKDHHCFGVFLKLFLSEVFRQTLC
jgi:hypothetical protein